MTWSKSGSSRKSLDELATEIPLDGLQMGSPIVKGSALDSFGFFVGMIQRTETEKNFEF